ncbi:esterase/lipase family protein [Ectothiorhodospira lacustris]|uniref:esterase/lipase family protein n=1 Tax=Ectothiorhodospira lacustris TaxID=2899127 RepID=UPI001EE8E995|nr:alpha/beta fold hydrolase [Ectothiorhodospira lacustris]MCG5502146.1 alpha/beta fold hydrolase [Ectothiorhodospira lacustris]MCG5510972.1 alpha/beta fold hydrolase [Ectothiorhodospira lacustris]MCG5522704.1 alpha/beta fold hydrolase [Ectothiorhodospira lacustris]
MRRLTLFILLLLLLVVFTPFTGWVVWTERNPDLEREFRITVQERLETWFPEAMSLPPELIGFIPRGDAREDTVPDVVLIHGLDEPGGIWDDLIPLLEAACLTVWEFRYPNDQAIDRSADLLAEHWKTLDAGRSVTLIGHSMGGLVIRDFVSRWRHPVEETSELSGPRVMGTVMVGTPNQGSEWARLRVWLEVREWLADIPEGRFSLWAGLRDGTGAAKIDLQPDSEFLRDLNRRPWPAEVPVRVIGGQLTEPTPTMRASLDVLSEELGIEDLPTRLEAWWSSTGESLGDGAVPVISLAFDGAPEPVIVPASHRGLLVQMPFADQKPPAIPLIVEQLQEWNGGCEEQGVAARSNQQAGHEPEH